MAPFLVSSRASSRQVALMRSCCRTVSAGARGRSVRSAIPVIYKQLHESTCNGTGSISPPFGRVRGTNGLPGIVRTQPRRVLSTSAAFNAPGAVGTDGETAEDSSRTSEDKDKDEEDDFDDPRVAILDAALEHVHEHGFSAVALAAGAKDCGFHSVATGMFPGEGADLVHHVMAKALHAVKSLSVDDADKGDTLENDNFNAGDRREESSSTARLREGIKAALLVVEPYKPRWSQAMGIGALPQNAGTTATALAVLADELAFLSGDRSTDLAWYGKRGVIGGIHASTELFMLTDESEGLRDTWGFLDRRLEDYEAMSSSPQNIADVATGVSTVAASLSSAVVSLAGPFLRQASKQVPGGETLVNAGPTAAALASQALSLAASRLPHGVTGGSAAPTSSDSTNSAAAGPTSPDVTPPTFPGAPEIDPWLKAKDGNGKEADGDKFEEELAREERELFGDDRGSTDKKSGR